MKKALVACYAAFGVLLAVSILAASSRDEGLVEDGYSGAAQRYFLEKEQERRAGLWVEVSGALRQGESPVAVTVTAASGPLRGAEVTLEARRVGSARQDRRFRLLESEPGRYVGPIDLPAPGRWILNLAVRRGPIRAQRRWIAAVSPAQGDNEKDDIGRDLERGPATGMAGRFRVTLQIKPRPIRAMRELSFTVLVPGYDGPAPWIDLSMPGMVMPPNRVLLRKESVGRYTGAGVIVRCPSGRRKWAAKVVLPGHGNATFLFEHVD